MLGETSIFTCPGKVPFRQKCQNDVFCGNMNNDVPPYISKFKFFIKNTYSTMTTCNHVGLVQSKSEMIYFPKKVFLIIIHKSTTHILDMSHCQQHQQKSFRNENTKIYMFIFCSLQQKPFQLCLNVSSQITKLYKHGQVMMQCVTITSTHYYTRYLMRYRTFSPSLTCLGYNAMCYHNMNMLPHALP